MTACLLTVATAQRSPVQMDVRPLFGLTVPPYGCLPLQITVQNDGPSVNATLVVEPSRWQAERRHFIPLPLPTGTRKTVVALPFVLPNSMSVKVRLDGVRPMPEHILPVTPNEFVRLAVVVGDEIGGLEFLHKLNRQVPSQPSRPRPAPPGLSSITWSWTYCRPEDLPDKTAAFTGVSVLVLASGAERLTRAQWEAIRRWVMMGGVLIVPGGSAAIYLRHVVLAALLPIQNWRTQEWRDWRALSAWLQTPIVSEPCFITVGQLRPGAKALCGANGVPLVAVRPYGWGAVVFTAFNLWDKPFRGWHGLPVLWHRTVVPWTTQTVAEIWERTLFPLGQWAVERSRWFAPPFMIGGQPRQPPPLPFRLELPSSATITLTLLVYFVLVVPVSYAWLRRRHSLDWQWLIAPTLAVAFVFIVARSAFGLYQLGNQNIARSTILLTSGERDGYLFAGATLFMQRGGVYTLDLGADAEAVFTQVGEDIWMTPTVRLDTVEDRTLQVPLSVPNLGFRLIYFAKPFTLNGTVEMTARRQGTQIAVVVTNRTPFTLAATECRPATPVMASPRTFGWQWQHRPAMQFGVAMPLARLGNLAPGQTATTTLTLPPRTVSVEPRWLILTAQIDGLDIAPSLSVSAQRKSYVTLQVVCPVQ